MFAIRVDRGFDGVGPLAGGVVVVVDESTGRIVSVGGPDLPVPEGVARLDHPGCTVLPGLVNAHVHLCADNGPGALDRLPDHSEVELAAIIETSLRQQLAVGVTTVRDLGDRRGAVLEWRERTGSTQLPTVVGSGPPITTPGGHCWNMGGETSGVDGVRAAVRDRVERGADVIKVMASGGMLTEGTDVFGCQFSDAELHAAVDAAHAAGLPLTAHAHALSAIEQAIRCGADGIEHCTGLTPTGVGVPDAVVADLAAAGIAVDPTLGLAPDFELPARMRAIMERVGLRLEERGQRAARLHHAGVRIALGDDAGINPGKPHGLLPHAVTDLAGGGVAGSDALAAATSVSAEALRLGDRKGRLRAGYDADLLVVAGDPVADIAALLDVRAVFLRGHEVLRRSR